VLPTDLCYFTSDIQKQWDYMSAYIKDVAYVGKTWEMFMCCFT